MHRAIRPCAALRRSRCRRSRARRSSARLGLCGRSSILVRSFEDDITVARLIEGAKAGDIFSAQFREVLSGRPLAIFFDCA
jgi:hypothetical protein